MKLADLSIVTVVRELGGPEPRGKRIPAWWRDGDGLSVSIDPAKNVWYDFVSGEGGGVLKLAELVLNSDRGAALRFLETHCGLDPRQPSSEERAQRARAQLHADRVAQGAEDFVHGLRLALTRHRDAVSAAIGWLLEHDVDPSTSLDLARVNRAIAMLDGMKPRELVRLYIDAGADDPELQGQLVARGRADRLDAERVTGAIVELLAA